MRAALLHFMQKSKKEKGRRKKWWGEGRASARPKARQDAAPPETGRFSSGGAASSRAACLVRNGAIVRDGGEGAAPSAPVWDCGRRGRRDALVIAPQNADEGKRRARFSEERQEGGQRGGGD